VRERVLQSVVDELVGVLRAGIALVEGARLIEIPVVQSLQDGIELPLESSEVKRQPDSFTDADHT